MDEWLRDQGQHVASMVSQKCPLTRVGCGSIGVRKVLARLVGGRGRKFALIVVEQGSQPRDGLRTEERRPPYMKYKRQFLGTLLSLALMATMTGLGALRAPVARAARGVDVFVGYADTVRANPLQLPTPWEGSPSVMYQGCSPSTGPSACSVDPGAGRFVNNTCPPV